MFEDWVVMCEEMKINSQGNSMKNEIMRLGIVSPCTEYIMHSPDTKNAVFGPDHPRSWPTGPV